MAPNRRRPGAGGDHCPASHYSSLTHRVPAKIPAGEPPYTFVTEGVVGAVEKARLTINLVPVILGGGVRLLDGSRRGPSTWSSSGSWMRSASRT
jgi:hypothetical protein